MLVALKPTTDYPAAAPLVLAPRPADPYQARYVLLQTMPPGAGLEPAIEAVNAVMAGARPEHLPLILAAVQLFGDIELMRQFDNPTGALLLMTPKRARALADQGLDRSKVTELPRDAATVRLGDFRANGLFPLIRALIQRPVSPGRAALWPADYLTRPDDDPVPMYPPSGVKLTVVGGDVASVMQLWNSIHHRTTRIAPWR